MKNELKDQEDIAILFNNEFMELIKKYSALGLHWCFIWDIVFNARLTFHSELYKQIDS